MNKNWLLVLTALVLIIFLVFCRWWSYTGDGHFQDRSCLAPEPRYTLRLGAVDLSKKSSYTYMMKGLPEDYFTIGFRIVDPASAPQASSSIQPHIGETRPINPQIRLSLSNEQKLTVIDIAGAVRHEWVWSYTYGSPSETWIYGRGKKEEVKTGKDSSTYKLLGVLADKGWGTSFIPRSTGEYYLVLEVLEGDPDAKDCRIELEANGGGYVEL